jgi:flagellar basal body-associated protein FliL
MKKRLKIILRILLGMFLAIAGLLILAYIFASEDTQYEYSPEKREVVETMIDVSSNKAYRTKIQDATSGRL